MALGPPFCPQDLSDGHGPQTPNVGLLHRSYGQYPGDLSVVKSGGLAHWVVGYDTVWAQTIDTSQVTYNCGNWNVNNRSVAIEFTGINEEPLTPFQQTAGWLIISWARDTHGIPFVYIDDGMGGPVNYATVPGWYSHAAIVADQGAQHTDMITVADWNKIVLVGLQGGLSVALTDDDVARIAKAVGGSNQALWGQTVNLGDIVNEIHAARDQLQHAISNIPTAQAAGSGVTEAEVRALLNETKLSTP